MVTDTISDMFTRIRNASLISQHMVQIPKTKITSEIARILKEEGFIRDLETFNDNNREFLLLLLKYKGKDRKPVISCLKRISKPGLRIYSNSKRLPKVLGNLGIAIISTSRGLMTNIDAKKLGIGGEILGYIW
jgi:small subunit ribosomal protein S8